MLITEIDDLILHRQFTFLDTNYLSYPYIRWNLASMLANSNNSEASSVRPIKASFNEKIKVVYLNFLKSALKISSERDVLFFTAGIGNSRFIQGKYFNRLCDYFVQLVNSHAVIESSHRGKIFSPRIIDEVYYSDVHGLFDLVFLLKQKIHQLVSTNKIISSEPLSDYLFSKEVISERERNLIAEKIQDIGKKIKYYEHYYKNLFHKVKPRIIFVEDGCYGGLNAYIIKWAKELGIITAELQHGMISKTHYAYNFGLSYNKSDLYEGYYPDYLLLYGEYWQTQVCVPSKTVIIGHPHFFESKKALRDIKEVAKTILIVSQWTITSKMVQVAKYLSEKLSDYQILFKLHPREIENESSYIQLRERANIEIFTAGDIYSLIAKAENIVGHTSTVLFEAAGFSKRIFVLDDEDSRQFIPVEIGYRFSEESELVNLIYDPSVKNEQFSEFFFNSDWEINFRNFLKSVVGIDSTSESSFDL